MSIAKAVVTGTVYRAPEKRFTQNNVAVSAFVLDMGDREEMLIRVISKRQILDEIVDTLNKGDRVLVEGRLQISSVQGEDGTDKKVMEIDLSSFEVLSSSQSVSSSSSSKNSSDEVVKFSEVEMNDVLIGEEEIPF